MRIGIFVTVKRRKLVTWGSMRTWDMVTKEKVASLNNPKKVCMHDSSPRVIVREERGGGMES